MNRSADRASSGSTQLSFERKYRQIVRVDSPHAAAMSSPLVPETPRSQNSLQACRDTSRRACSCFSLMLTSCHLVTAPQCH